MGVSGARGAVPDPDSELRAAQVLVWFVLIFILRVRTAPRLAGRGGFRVIYMAVERALAAPASPG
jgi:hypothetical protein